MKPCLFLVCAVNPEGQMTENYVEATNKDHAETKFIKSEDVTGSRPLTEEGAYPYDENDLYENIHSTEFSSEL